jgi:hypothetical protein
MQMCALLHCEWQLQWLAVLLAAALQCGGCCRRT